jgi:hypothetical protein
MEKYDIIQVFRDYQKQPTSERYVLLELFPDGKVKAVIQESIFLQGDDTAIKFHTLFLNKDRLLPWKTVDKANVSLINNPHYKVICKIKLMNAKRKEQGYAF